MSDQEMQWTAEAAKAVLMREAKALSGDARELRKLARSEDIGNEEEVTLMMLQGIGFPESYVEEIRRFVDKEARRCEPK
jgi:hypothetical protein